MIEFVERRDANGELDPSGWTCCDHMGEEICDAPARAILEDGRWCYMAACGDEKHAADALRLHDELKASEGLADYCWPSSC